MDLKVVYEVTEILSISFFVTTHFFRHGFRESSFKCLGVLIIFLELNVYHSLMLDKSFLSSKLLVIFARFVLVFFQNGDPCYLLKKIRLLLIWRVIHGHRSQRALSRICSEVQGGQF